MTGSRGRLYQGRMLKSKLELVTAVTDVTTVEYPNLFSLQTSEPQSRREFGVQCDPFDRALWHLGTGNTGPHQPSQIHSRPMPQIP
jgi:hypothetical protein